MVTVLILKRKKEMQKVINKYSKLILLVITICIAFSCSKDEDIANLDETIFIRHKDADMPAYIHGNASEFLNILVSWD